MDIKMRKATASTPAVGMDFGPTANGEPAIKGKGDTNYLCAACDAVVIQGVQNGQFGSGMQFNCPKCGANNVIV